MTWYKENRKALYGIGINDADYPVQKMKVNEEGKTERQWTCPYYSRWYDIFRRCYNKKALVSHPTYETCSVCEDWKYFTNFKKWMELQDWEGKCLDKDLLVKGNQVYSPDTCMFISNALNTFISKGRRGQKYLTGISWHKRDKVFTAQCHDIILGKLAHLGYHKTEEGAHNKYLEYKRGLIPRMLEVGLISSEEHDLLVKWYK